MHAYALFHLSDAVLLRDLAALAVQDRRTTASLLAHIAEVDARRLYVPAGFPSMHAYCVQELRLSEDVALKRIQAARAARLFPAIFEGVGEGRLHVSGVCLLAPYLTAENAEALLEEASGRRKSEIETILAKRFPPLTEEVPQTFRTLASVPWSARLAPALGVDDPTSTGRGDQATLVGSVGTVEHAPGHVHAPRSEGRYVLQVTVDENLREKLRHAQALLSHAVPSGDVAEILDRALDVLITSLEKRKLGVGGKPAAERLARGRRRYVPAHVRRAVWERDGGQCTFVSVNGRRCESRKFLEYDHIDPVARGGEATIERMRLLCRAHNQYEAERIFGAELMRGKRRGGRSTLRDRQQLVPASGQVPEVDSRADLLAGLRRLGFRVDEARRAAEHTKSLQAAPIEDRFRAALQYLGRERAPIQRAPTSG